MTKRFFALLFASFMLISQITAYADVIMANEFQFENKEAMLELDRSRFCVSSPSGYVVVQEQPGLEEVKRTYEYDGYSSEYDLATYKNGEELPIDCAYIHNGEYWGVITPNHYIWEPGWIPMKHLFVVYVPQDFEKENEDKFYEYKGNDDEVFAAERIVLWAWPGSDREKRIIDDKGYTLQSVDTYKAYKDSEGCEWGYVRLNYDVSYIRKEGWICFNDPGNSQIPAFNPAPKPMPWSPDGVYEWIHLPIVAEEEQYSLSNIVKVRTYKPNETFTDVLKTSWYYEPVATAYEYGVFDDISAKNSHVISEIDDNGNTIFNNRGNDKFNPSIKLRRPEALVMAARFHVVYKYGQEIGDSILNAYSYAYARGGTSANYPTGIIEYCRIEGLVDGEGNYYPYFSRAEMIHTWARILKPKDMAKQNIVLSLPDVNIDTPYAEDIILFYEAGIISGVDAEGTFNPDGSVTRAEASAIFSKLIDKNKRHSGKTYGN